MGVFGLYFLGYYLQQIVTVFNSIFELLQSGVV